MKTSTATPQKKWTPRVIGLSLIFSLAQVVQEVVSERVFDGKTNQGNSMASLAMFYAFTQQVACSIVALAMIHMSDKPEKRNAPPWDVTFQLAALIGLSSSFANWAVEFVFYPAKVVMKSTKLVPTMMVSPLLGNSKSYSLVEYVSAVFLSLGAAGFALSSGRLHSLEDGPDISLAWIGLLLLTLASLGDAVVPNLQQRTMRRGASPEEMALRVNTLSALAIFLTLYANGSVKPWLELWARDPSSLVLMVFGGFTFSIAVISYTFLIVEAGSVTAVSVATIRKVVTLTLSYILFPGKTFTGYHVLSLGLFGMGLSIGPINERFKTKEKTEQV